MTRSLYFITHPNVVIDPTMPVTRWPLSPRGRKRMQAGLRQPWIAEITAVYCSTEPKAIDGAAILAEPLGLDVTEIAELGENDRTSTGFLEPAEFERTADAFFDHPEQSVRGWERVVDAQTRVVAAVHALASDDNTHGAIAIVAHGAVGALLYCAMSGQPISRQWDQPPTGGGNYFRFTIDPPRAETGWQPFDLPAKADR